MWYRTFKTCACEQGFCTLFNRIKWELCISVPIHTHAQIICPLFRRVHEQTFMLEWEEGQSRVLLLFCVCAIRVMFSLTHVQSLFPQNSAEKNPRFVEMCTSWICRNKSRERAELKRERIHDTNETRIEHSRTRTRSTATERTLSVHSYIEKASTDVEEKEEDHSQVR